MLKYSSISGRDLLQSGQVLFTPGCLNVDQRWKAALSADVISVSTVAAGRVVVDPESSKDPLTAVLRVIPEKFGTVTAVLSRNNREPRLP